MGNIFRSSYVDGVDALDSAGLDTPFDQLDQAIGNLGNHGFATVRSPLGIPVLDASIIKFGIIDVWHHRDSDGAMVHNVIAAGTANLISDTTHAYALVADLSDTNSTADTTVITTSIVDIDALPTTLNDRSKMIIVMRGRAMSGITSYNGLLHYVGLKPCQPLRGTANMGTGTTPKIIDIPAYQAIPGTSWDYQVILTPTSAATFWDLKPYVNNKTGTSFDIVFVGTGASETFDWLIIP